MYIVDIERDMLYNFLYIGAPGATQKRVGIMGLELFLLLAGIGLIVGGFFVTGVVGSLMLVIGGVCIGFLACELYVVTSLWNP